MSQVAMWLFLMNSDFDFESMKLNKRRQSEAPVREISPNFASEIM